MDTLIYALIRLKKDGVRLRFARLVLKHYYSQQSSQLAKIVAILRKQQKHGNLERRLVALDVISTKIFRLKLTRQTLGANTREDKTAREIFADVLDHLDGLELRYTYHTEGEATAYAITSTIFIQRGE